MGTFKLDFNKVIVHTHKKPEKLHVYYQSQQCTHRPKLVISIKRPTPTNLNKNDINLVLEKLGQNIILEREFE